MILPVIVVWNPAGLQEISRIIIHYFSAPAAPKVVLPQGFPPQQLCCFILFSKVAPHFAFTFPRCLPCLAPHASAFGNGEAERAAEGKPSKEDKAIQEKALVLSEPLRAYTLALERCLWISIGPLFIR
jgi:hypothetical protein